MEESLTLFTWFSGILIVAIVIIDILLSFKFRRYFLSNGFGIVTITLVSLVIAHAIGALLFAMTSLSIIITSGKSNIIYTLKDFGAIWIMSSTLLHIMGITFQRVFSFSYGNAFLQFTRSKTNISLLIITMWIASLIMTIICVTSRVANTLSVFYLGSFSAGVLAIINFMITVETSLYKNKSCEGLASPTTSIRMTEKGRIRVVQNPKKTFSLFSGLVFSFILFCLPASIPNLIFNLQGKMLSQSTSLVISLWLLLGIVFNCMWILMRLRSTINDTSGFYARWTLGKSKENITMFLRRGQRDGKSRLLPEDDIDESIGIETEQEHI